MNLVVFWISVFLALLCSVYFCLFIRFTYRLCTDYSLPLHVVVRVDESQIESIIRKIK